MVINRQYRLSLPCSSCEVKIGMWPGMGGAACQSLPVPSIRKPWSNQDGEKAVIDLDTSKQSLGGSGCLSDFLIIKTVY